MNAPQTILIDDFVKLAQQYWQAYNALPEAQPPSWPRYFLFCHSLELILKAYLAASRRLSQQQLKDIYRHDLGALLTDAESDGLCLGQAKANLQVLTNAHTQFWPRYPMERAVPVAIINRDQFEPDAKKLFSLVFAALGYGTLA